MISGDTGWINISDYLAPGITHSIPPVIRIRRVDNEAYLSFDSFAPDKNLPSLDLLNIPPGFGPGRPFRIGSGATYELEQAIYTAGRVLRTRYLVQGGSRRFYVSWAVSDDWPTVI